MTKAESMFVRKWAHKLRAVRELGGKCCICGTTNLVHLVFHHDKPETKKITISRLLTYRWRVVWEEVSKCQLLCGNCHRELHANGGTKLKQALLRYKEAEGCSKCGHRSPTGASLDFHHKGKKNFNIGTVCRGNSAIGSMELVEKEIASCEVLCKNCHLEEATDMERLKDWMGVIVDKSEHGTEQPVVDGKAVLQLHAEGVNGKQIAEKLGCATSTVSVWLKRNGLTGMKEKQTFTKVCPRCENTFTTDRPKQKHCSMKCASTCHKLKISESLLRKKLATGTYSSIAREYGVVPNTIRNMAKRYGLI